MPTITDVLDNFKIGAYSFIIIAAGAVILWGALYVFNQHHRMNPPKTRIIIAGCAFIAFLFVWFVLSGISWLGHQISDMRTAAVGRQNRGLGADIIQASPIHSVNLIAGAPTNGEVGTLQGVISSPENRTLQSGIDMSFVLHVYNSGEPTTAWGFNSYIVLPDGKEMDASIPSVLVEPDKDLGIIPTSVGNYKLSGDKFLLNALAFTPMATGAAGDYWLTVHVNGLSEVQSGTLFVITFKDVFNRTTTIQDRWIPNQ
jgi:hypothetical protein